MTSTDIEDTQPIKITGETQPTTVEPTQENQIDDPQDSTPTLVQGPRTQIIDETALDIESTQPSPAAAPGMAGLPPETLPTVTQRVQVPPAAATPAQHPPTAATPARRRRASCLLTGGLGLLAILVIAGLAALGGYASGISLRRGAASTQVAQSLQDQFQLGVQDIELGQYARARQRFEYILNQDPSYPGAQDKLTEALLQLSITATPTLLPTPTLTPTPDLRSVQELYNQAQQALASKDWSGAIDSALALRKNDSAYEAVAVDGILYIALRNRGREKILNADLEGGIYDLTLASKFAPLDAEAQGLLNWTTLYITGLSFWGIDWEQVVSYLSQVAPQTPNLSDGPGWTVTTRLREAYVNYGDQLAQGGRYCRSVEMYRNALQMGAGPEVEQAAAVAAKGCDSGQGQTEQTPGVKPTKKPKGTPSP